MQTMEYIFSDKGAKRFAVQLYFVTPKYGSMTSIWETNHGKTCHG